jgi:rsbT co-antagonist protein RsbR
MDGANETVLLHQRIAELERSEARYRSIFENSPISLWEEDWSALKTRLNQLIASGTMDLDSHFKANFDEVIECVSMVKILDVNKATLDMCRAVSKAQLLTGLSIIFNDTALQTFHRQLVAIGNGAKFFEEETVICTLDREPVNVVFRIAVSVDCEQTWERCCVSLLDITDRKRAEDALSLSQSKEETIRAQRSTLAKLSTPVIPISDQIMVVPLIGALDTTRMQQAMSVLLDELQRRGASIAILDVTGVPEIDAEAANGIILAAQAVRLLGAQVVLTGIRPHVARSLVELGSDLHGIVTRSTLQAGIAYAIREGGSWTGSARSARL